MNLTLIPAEETDLPELLALCHRAARAAEDSRWSEDYPNAAILREDYEQGHLLRIENEAGETLGLIAVHETGEDEFRWPEPYDSAWELSRLALEPKRQDRGLGTAAFRCALDWCRKRGCKAARLLVSRDYDRAIHIYEKEGFARLGEGSAWGEDFYLYGKRL